MHILDPHIDRKAAVRAGRYGLRNKSLILSAKKNLIYDLNQWFPPLLNINLQIVQNKF